MNVLDRLKYECEYGRRDLLLALGDEAEERGEADLAAGYRWLGTHNKRPVYTTTDGVGEPEYWWNRVQTPSMCSSLSYEVQVPELKRFPSEYEALTAAALAVGSWLREKAGKENQTQE